MQLAAGSVALPSALQDALPAKEHLMHVIHHVHMFYFVNRLVLSKAGGCRHLLLKLKALACKPCTPGYACKLSISACLPLSVMIRVNHALNCSNKLMQCILLDVHLCEIMP